MKIRGCGFLSAPFFMGNFFYLYVKYSHSLISKFIKLISMLYELESDSSISDKEVRNRLSKILKNFESEASYLHEDMVTYHVMDSIQTTAKKEQVFHHINMEFKYILN